jgi:endoglucanase
MLLAESIGDQVDFARIWSWTHAHLQLPDGLLGYLADPSGTMRNPQAASDADVLAAWALSRASAPRAAAYHAQARLIARAILGHEMVSRGRLLMLAAGPWATGSPVSLDPSYWSPVAFDALARFTHDARWAALTRSAESLSAALTSGGKTLPPDWARVDGTVATPTAAPNGEARQVQYGLDAQRLVVWLAASCDAAARRLAASWWKLLAPTVRAALALSPAGSILNSQTNATPLVAAAAAATAAGRSAERDRLLDAADRVQSSHPTYYGAAWLALGRTLLTTAALGGCATRTGS